MWAIVGFERPFRRRIRIGERPGMRSVGLRGVRKTRSHPVDVGAAAEGATGPREDQHANLGIVLDRLDACEEGAYQLPIEGVAALGAVEREPGDAAPVGLE